MRVKIVEYKKEYNKIYDKYIDIIKTYISPNDKIYHVGSMSVPMLGRQEFDIIIFTNNINTTFNSLANAGFLKGPLKKDIGYMRSYQFKPFICELHITNSKAYLNEKLNFVKRLRFDKKFKAEYTNLKKRLNGCKPEVYDKQKKEFISNNKV